MGFKQVAYPTQKSSKGRTTYSWSRKVTLALDTLISYSNKPLTIIAFFGIGISIVSFVIVLYLLVGVYATVLPQLRALGRPAGG